VDQFLADEDRKRSRITDAETTPDGAWVALRTNAELLLVRTRDLVAGKLDDVWHVDLRPFDETQGEGVAISNGGDVYLARGRRGTRTAGHIYAHEVSTSGFVGVPSRRADLQVRESSPRQRAVRSIHGR
jgi:hypothetical protein